MFFRLLDNFDADLHVCHQLQMSRIANLAPLWVGLVMRRGARINNDLNIDVLGRMARLQHASNGKLPSKCHKHFDPSEQQATTELAYRPLDVGVMSGMFVVLTVMTIASVGVLIGELAFSRMGHLKNPQKRQIGGRVELSTAPRTKTARVNISLLIDIDHNMDRRVLLPHIRHVNIHMTDGLQLVVNARDVQLNWM